jgi:hypothetical protein
VAARILGAPESYFAPLGILKEWFDALKRASGHSYEVKLVAEGKLWSAAEFLSSSAVVMSGPGVGQWTQNWKVLEP